jgi:hypothetical protein
VNILSQIIAHGDRDDLECILATILNVFEKIDVEYDGHSAMEFKIAELVSANRALAADNIRLKEEAALLAKNIEGLRKIIDNERATTGDPRPVWEYMP